MSSSADHARRTSLVINPHTLSKLPAKETIPIDVSWFMPNVTREPSEEFVQKRIPRARRLDLDAVASDHPLGLKHMMPSSKLFAETCEIMGVSPDSHVILYDTTGVFSSPRALFMFRAFGHESSSILDGGLLRWMLEGHEVESGPVTEFAKSKYPEPVLNSSVIRDYEQIANNVLASNDEAEIVLDARSNGRFTGKDPEPRPNLSSGHMPHSRSLPFSDLLRTEKLPGGGTYTTLLDIDIRRKIVEGVFGNSWKSVLDGHRRVTNTCGSGMTAAILWLTMQELGICSALYDEAWSGYALRPESKILQDK